MDYCENKFDNIDGMAVIFGNPKLFDVNPYFDLVSDLMRTYKKPIYPIFTSVINAKDEIQKFVDKGNVVFFDEVTFGDAFGKVMNTAGAPEIISDPYEVDVKKIREVIDAEYTEIEDTEE